MNFFIIKDILSGYLKCQERGLRNSIIWELTLSK